MLRVRRRGKTACYLLLTLSTKYTSTMSPHSLRLRRSLDSNTKFLIGTIVVSSILGIFTIVGLYFLFRYCRQRRRNRRSMMNSAEEAWKKQHVAGAWSIDSSEPVSEFQGTETTSESDRHSEPPSIRRNDRFLPGYTQRSAYVAVRSASPPPPPPQRPDSPTLPLLTMYIVSPQDFEAHLTSPARVDFIFRTLRVLREDLAKLDISLYVETLGKRKKIPGRILELVREWGSAPYIHENPPLLDLSEAPNKNLNDVRQKYLKLFESTIPNELKHKKLSDEETERFCSMWPVGEHDAHGRLIKFIDERIGEYQARRNKQLRRLVSTWLAAP